MNEVDKILQAKGFTKTETRVYTDARLTELTLEYKFVKQRGMNKKTNLMTTSWVRVTIIFDLLGKTFKVIDNSLDNEYISQIELHKLIDIKLKDLGWI